MIRFIVFLIILVTFPAYADECYGKYYKKLDICLFLRQGADEMAKSLPMQLDSTMFMTKTYAIGKTLTIEATYLYDRQWLQNYLTQSGSSNEQVKELLIKKAKDTWCEGDYMILIKNGAVIPIPSPKITRLLHEFYRFLRPGKCYRQLKNPQHSCPVNL